MHYTFQLQISSNRKKMYLCWRTHTVHSHTHPQCSGFLFLLHCSIKGQGPSAVAPRVLTSRNITFVYSVRTKVLPNELRCHFLYLVCVCVCAACCWINRALFVGADHRSLSLSSSFGKAAICLEQHRPSCAKSAETEKKCADLCKMHCWTLHDGHDSL